MKKLLLLTVFGVFVLGLQAQNPFAIYQSDKTTGVAAHQFSASATVINLTQGARLDSLWIGKNGLSGVAEDTLTATPTTRRNNIEIGFDFPFAGKTMKYYGFTAGGLVFFGESDSLAPAVNLKDQNSTQTSDYVRFIFCAFSSQLSNNITWLYNPLTAGTDACVRYERVQDTLFIAYENLQGVDKFGNVLGFSFQYAFDKSGNISFRPVSMEPQQAHNASSGAYYWGYSFGLVAQKGSALRFLSKADGTSELTSKPRVELTQTSHPVAGESYNFFFFPPEPCAAVASPQVGWDYEVQGYALWFGKAMTWNDEATAALFILSRKSTLEGDDLPVNGTVYPNGGTVGSSVFVTTGAYNIGNNRNHFQLDKVENLEPATTYYLYAFPYNNKDCSGGPVYNTTDIPSQSFRTYYKEPASLRVKTVTDTSAELQIAVDATATRYMLAFDTLQLDVQTDMKIDETKTYAAGDEIAIGERKLRVIDPCAEDPVYTWKGLEQGKDYYCYAWSVNAERDWYSRGVASCGVAPVRALPATIDFASAAAVSLKAESWNMPAGWDEESGNTYNYVLREDTSDNKNIKMLSVQSTYASEDVASRSAVLSPYVDRGEEESVKAAIELVYWALEGYEMVASKPKTGDTLLVEYQDADGAWSEIAREGASAAVRQDGSYTLSTESFTPKKVFRLRFTVKSSTPTVDMESEERSTPYVGIRALTLSSSSCQVASNLQVVEGSLSPTGVTLSWKDENAIAPLEYRVLYKEEAETEWNVYPVTRPSVQLTDLKAGGSYTAMVRTFCTDEDSARSQRIVFTTLSSSSCTPATSLRATHLMATSVDLSWKGNGLSYAVIYAPRVGDIKADTLYTEQTSVSLTDLIPNTPYSVYVVSYCGAEYTLPSGPSATAYFNTPVLCSAPRIEVVEGSVTWQGVHLAIDAPVPDCQLRVIPKDEDCPVAEYRVNTSKDTVKLYGMIDCENITYQAIARSLCLVDTSEWSEPVEFTTLPKPECGEPSNLWVGVAEGGRSATAHWTAGEKNKSWLLMHKEKDAQRYDSLPNVRETSSTFYGLKPNTVYTWRVQASCDHYLYSDLVYGEFNTADVSLSSAQFADKLRMRVDANQIEIGNADGVYIKTLEVISMDGKRLKTYTIHSSDNVLIPHTLPFGPAVFRITGEGGQTAVYKLMIP